MQLNSVQAESEALIRLMQKQLISVEAEAVISWR
jgi:hypothetical protein